MPGQRLLLICADTTSCRKIHARLAELGYSVTAAKSVLGAKRLRAWKKFAAVLLDRSASGPASVARKLEHELSAAGCIVPVLRGDFSSSGRLCAMLERKLAALPGRKQADSGWMEPLLMAVSDALVSVDKKGVVNFVNAAAERLLGLPRRRCIGQNIKNLFRLEFELDGKELRNPVFSSIATGKTLRAPLDIFLVTSSNKVPVGCKAAPVYGPGKAVSGAVLALWDVTVQKKAKLELERSEEQYRTLVESASSIILRTDISGKIIFFNEYGQRFFQCSEQFVLGRRFDQALKARLAEPLQLLLERIMSSRDKAYSREIEHYIDSNSMVWVSWNYKAVRNKANELEILCVGMDITALKKTQKELALANESLEQRVQERTRELAEAYAKLKEAHQGLIQLEKMAALGRFSAGIAHEIKNPLGIILSGAEYLLMKGVAHAQFTDRELDEAGRRKLLSALAADGVAVEKGRDSLEALNILVEDNKLYDGHFRMDKRLDGRRDIARLAMASEPFRQQSREDLLPHEACSVDFLNRMCIEVAYSPLCPHSPAVEIYEALLKIKEAVLRADTIVKNLLKFSRPAELKKEALAPDEVMDFAISNIPEKERVRAVINTSYEKGLMVEGDRNQLMQVFINIVSNALQSIPDGNEGRLDIRSYRQKAAVALDWDCVIEVQDNGSGIKKENMPRLFEPFFTTKVYDKTTAHKEHSGLRFLGNAGEAVQGTGLGLSVCKAIVTSHKGEIEVNSEEGKGTVVRIKLPLMAGRP